MPPLKFVNMRPVTIRGCTVLGGSGYQLEPNSIISIQFGNAAVMIVLPDASSFNIPYVELVEIQIGGPGSVTSGGGYIGGGFGVAGALEGIAVASILNSLTSRTKIHTFISIVTHIGELHLHYTEMEPAALRMSLSGVFSILRKLDQGWIEKRLRTIDALQRQDALDSSESDRLRGRLLDLQIEDKPSSQFQGRCPRCNSVIPLTTEQCKCGAMFGRISEWEIQPI